jgi:predicted AlkP superfamily pyrophosphatase or phosphodiesterase
MLAAVVVLIHAALAGQAAQSVTLPAIAHVVVVSIDGLRPDAIDERADGSTPALARILRGSGTLNARTDPEITVTLPNHLSMVTGRSVGGAEGHGWIANEDPPAIRHGGTIQKKTGRYIPSMFDVAHDRGVQTGVFVSKTKFWLLIQCYGETEGAPDALPPDHGKCKIDVLTYSAASRALAEQASAWLRVQRTRSLTLVHFSDPDVQGHTTGWDLTPSSPYLAAVATADAALGSLLATIDASPELRGRTAVIVTTDHGGGEPFKSHTEPLSAVNFRIPFLVWMGSDRPRADLYELNRTTRVQPGLEEYIGRDAAQQPIRCADAGNLALHLLGLPAIPGSHANAAQDLVLQAANP